MRILDKIVKSEDVKKLNLKELKILSQEIRQEILDVTRKNGGHLSSNLGIVETTIALHYVFDFPNDKLVFDVGHQCYANKILSNRKEDFSSLRTTGGLSGFPDKEESEFDSFTSGHAGTSIASSLGLCRARDSVKDDYAVVNLVGDGSIVNGLSLEGIISSTKKPKNYILILNDNGMSISLNKNGLYTYFSKTTTGKGYVKGKSFIKRVFGDSFVSKFLSKIKNWFKKILNKGISFEYFGFKYVGKIDGNDIGKTIKILQRVKNIAKDKAVLLHLTTTKGKGFTDAEERSDLYHGVGKNLEFSSEGFGEALGQEINNLIDKDDRIIAITAGMKDGTGLDVVQKEHPNNFYDVGIAEEYAVTYASGLATGGLKPIVAIYSTFMQRTYDQILHDVCLQNLPVIFCLDRAGLVGEDGKTHQGVFDLSYLSHMPNLTVLAPTSKEELNDMLNYALKLNGPVAIRYPKKYNKAEREFEPLSNGLWQRNTEGDNITVLAVGPRMLELALDFSKQFKGVEVINARSIKPLDYEMLKTIRTPNIFTLEENVISGGFGSLISQYYSDKSLNVRVYNFGVKDEFIKHGTVDWQFEYNGLNVKNLLKVAKTL